MPLNLRRFAWSVLLAVVLISTISAQRTTFQSTAGSSSSRFISPSVVASIQANGPLTSAATLDLLILWRGAPGWFQRGGRQGGGSSGSGGDTTSRIFYGDVQLTFSLNATTRIATIQGKDVPLGDANVILVDNVDRADQLTVVGTRRIDPAMPRGSRFIEDLIQRSPELVAFLRCEATVADLNLRAMLSGICSVMTGAASLPVAPTGPPKGMQLERVSWLEAKARLTPEAVVVIPLGAASKEHGPHLKLSNDWIMAEYFGRRIIASADVVLAPTINYSYYPAFVNYPGSTSLRQETARDMIVDIVKTLAASGPKRFYILNTGVSTATPLKAAQALLAADGIVLRFTDIIAVADSVVKSVTEQREGTHADEIETSMMLYIAPQAVDMSKAAKDYPTGTGPLTPVQGAAGRYSPSGVSGDATLATWEKGAKVVEATVAGILKEIEDLRRVGR